MQNSQNIQSPGLLHAMAWAEAFELIDLQLSPLGLQTIEALKLVPGDVVLDIGCGTGQTLLQLADRVGTKGQVIGVDIAPLLLEIATERAKTRSQILLIESDAEYLDLPSMSTDAVFSRFGVMGFSDPCAAFTNFHRILRPSGVLAFCCWRSLQENQLDWFPLSASGLQVVVDETPFSFANPEYIVRTLEAAGFGRINVQAYDQKVSSGDLDAMTSVLLKVGPLGKSIRENPALRTVAEPSLRQGLADLGDTEKVELAASIWIVTAQSGADNR